MSALRCLRVGRSGDLCKLCENCTNLPCCRSRGPRGSHTRDLLLTIQGILGIKWLALRGSHSEQLNARRRTYLERDGRSGIGRLPHSCRRPTYCSRVTFQLPCCYISAPFPAAETTGPIAGQGLSRMRKFNLIWSRFSNSFPCEGMQTKSSCFGVSKLSLKKQVHLRVNKT